jgi:hypothetical protein
MTARERPPPISIRSPSERSRSIRTDPSTSVEKPGIGLSRAWSTSVDCCILPGLFVQAGGDVIAIAEREAGRGSAVLALGFATALWLWTFRLLEVEPEQAAA